MTAVFKPGTRLRSQVCDAEVIVVRAGNGDVLPTCGGVALVPLDAPGQARQSGKPELMGGAAIGKRYTAEADPTFELLVTKPGAGTLGDGERPLTPREAKPLPASD